MPVEPFLLITIEAVYSARNKVAAVFPDLLCEVLPQEGDKIELRRPDGTRITTAISAIEHATLVDGGSTYPVRLPESITKTDLTMGTEVWWIASRVR